MNRILGLSLVVAGVTLLEPGRVAAQDRTLDNGVFVVTRDSTVIGREEFALRTGRRIGPDGFTLSARASYPPGRPTLRITAVIEFGPDSQPTTGQIEFDDGEAQRMLVAIEPRLVTVRSITPRGESARQYPTAARNLISDAALVSSFSLLQRGGTGQVALVEPRELRRRLASLVDGGMEQTEVDQTARTLHRYTLGSGADERRLWYDSQGQLQKMAMPSSGVVAVREARSQP